MQLQYWLVISGTLNATLIYLFLWSVQIWGDTGDMFMKMIMPGSSVRQYTFANGLDKYTRYCRPKIDGDDSELL